MRLRKAKPDLEEKKKITPQACQRYEELSLADTGRDIKTFPPPIPAPPVSVTDGPSAPPERQSAVSPGTTKYPDVEVSAFFISGRGEENYFFLKWQPAET